MSVGYLLEIYDLQCQPASTQAVRDALSACFARDCVICEHRDHGFLFVSILLHGGTEPHDHAKCITKIIGEVDQLCSFRLRYYPMDDSEECVVCGTSCRRAG
jgi:hypothetical protein